MKRLIRFIQIHALEIDGVKKRFMSGDLAEVEEKIGRELIARGVCVPGPQHGPAVRHKFSKE